MFKSIEYYIFLALVLIVYYSLPKRYAKHILLFASYLLYIYWEPTFFSVLLIETIVVYYAALLWSSNSTSHFNRNSIYYAVISCFSILFYFKYRPYLLLNETDATGYYNLLRPLGVSFFTFQGVAYLIDVKRGRRPNTNIIDIALYLSFFPQLVAGPIERAKKLIPQFSKPSSQLYENFSKGLFYIFFGLFLKIFVADNLDLFVQKSLYSGQIYNSYITLIGTGFFFIQLYADFSAYTLIAIGSASFFGISLSENFRQPFNSVSVSEFWRRWHMTLMLWLRDYIYIPVAKGKMVSKSFARGLATFLVFMFFAIWHGISFNFLLFGFLNFILAFFDAQVLARPTRHIFFQKTVRLLLLIFGYPSIILLAAVDNAHALQLVTSLFTFESDLSIFPEGIDEYQFAICILVCVILFLIDYIQEKNNQTLYLYTRTISFYKKITGYSIVMILFIMFGEFGHKEFAYFGF